MPIDLSDARVLREGLLPGGQGTIEVLRLPDQRVVIRRFAERGRVRTLIDKREVHSGGESRLEPLSAETADLVFQRIVSGESGASCVVFHEGEIPSSMAKTATEDQFTSTGKKFWRHPEKMRAYRRGSGHSIISTHVSPEGACNLKCPYCSVTYRDTHSRIELPRIKDYVEKLGTRGLEAVILTGGGEPTAYRDFDQLVTWLAYERGLKVALITNGTLSHRVSPETWRAFSWVRVSLNVFEGWEERISLPVEHLAEDCVVGCSMVYTAEHEATAALETDRLDVLKRACRVADKVEASYIRLLPNCALDTCTLLAQHAALERDIARLDDPRLFHQHKIHRTPKAHVCHQAYFRPYLGEEPWREDGRPGAVYPCDSVVLNGGVQFFPQKYQLCRPEDILDFLDGKLEMPFDPTEACTGCVFADNVDMLEDWKNGGPDRFEPDAPPMVHEEFP